MYTNFKSQVDFNNYVSVLNIQATQYSYWSCLFGVVLIFSVKFKSMNARLTSGDLDIDRIELLSLLWSGFWIGLHSSDSGATCSRFLRPD